VRLRGVVQRLPPPLLVLHAFSQAGERGQLAQLAHLPPAPAAGCTAQGMAFVLRGFRGCSACPTELGASMLGQSCGAERLGYAWGALPPSVSLTLMHTHAHKQMHMHNTHLLSSHTLTPAHQPRDGIRFWLQRSQANPLSLSLNTHMSTGTHMHNHTTTHFCSLSLSLSHTHTHLSTSHEMGLGFGCSGARPPVSRNIHSSMLMPPLNSRMREHSRKAKSSLSFSNRDLRAQGVGWGGFVYVSMR